MVYSDTALKNIILENIDNKKLVWVASQLYCNWNQRNTNKELEDELTKYLLNKQYERPRPEKPVTRTVSLN